jgi:flagellar FliL protein
VGGKLIKMIVTSVILLVLIAGGGGAAWYFLTQRGADPAKKSATAGTGHAMDPDAFVETPFFLDLGTFVVNLADGRRYLKASIQLVLSQEGAKAYLTARLAWVKDLVLRQLQNLTAESLRNKTTREDLERNIIREISTLLPAEPKQWKDRDPLKKVVITEFFIQ